MSLHLHVDVEDMCISSFSFITLLIRLLLDAPNTLDSQQCFAPFAGRVVTDIAVPNLVWRAGR